MRLSRHKDIGWRGSGANDAHLGPVAGAGGVGGGDGRCGASFSRDLVLPIHGHWQEGPLGFIPSSEVATALGGAVHGHGYLGGRDVVPQLVRLRVGATDEACCCDLALVPAATDYPPR